FGTFWSHDSLGASSESRSRSLFLFKFQGSRIHTVAESCWFGAVVEHVPKVRFASRAHYLDTAHTIAGISFGFYVFLCDRLIETRPPGSRLELCAGNKQIVSAAHALVDTLLVILPVLTGESAFGSFLAGDFILLLRELRLPFVFCLINLLAHEESFLRDRIKFDRNRALRFGGVTLRDCFDSNCQSNQQSKSESPFEFRCHRLHPRIKLYTSRRKGGKLQAFFKHVSTLPRYLKIWNQALAKVDIAMRFSMNCPSCGSDRI